MVEYSAGYKEKARQRLEAMDGAMTPKARAFARGLSAHFVKSSTKQPVAEPKADEEAA